MVVVENDLLWPDPALIVIPLLPDYPSVKGLILPTRLIAAARRANVRS